MSTFAESFDGVVELQFLLQFLPDFLIRVGIELRCFPFPGSLADLPDLWGDLVLTEKRTEG